MKNKISNILWGLCFIFFGIGLAGKYLFGWDFTIFFNGWWTLFIIIPCFISIVESGFHTSNMLGVSIGILFFLSSQNGLRHIFSWRLIVPLLLVFLGISIILSAFVSKAKPSEFSGERVEKKMSVLFGERKFVCNELFEGCTCSCSFGKSTIDLRGATIPPSCVITCHTSFGQTIIYLPDNVGVKPTINPVFGSLNINNNCSNYDQSNPTILIQGDCCFGQIMVE